MKKLALMVLMALCSVLAIAQDKTEKKLQLKNGTTLSGVVEVQTDGSYRLETAAGDVFFFSPSEVSKVIDDTPKADKKATAQLKKVSDAEAVVYRKGGNLLFKSTGAKLTQEDFASFEGWDKYRKAQNLHGWGNGLMYGGAGALAGFAIAQLALGDDLADEDIVIPAIVGSSSILITGVVLKLIGNKKIAKIGDGYNHNPGYVLDFGAQQSGIGFAIKF